MILYNSVSDNLNKHFILVYFFKFRKIYRNNIVIWFIFILVIFYSLLSSFFYVVILLLFRFLMGY